MLLCWLHVNTDKTIVLTCQKCLVYSNEYCNGWKNIILQSDYQFFFHLNSFRFMFRKRFALHTLRWHTIRPYKINCMDAVRKNLKRYERVRKKHTHTWYFCFVCVFGQIWAKGTRELTATIQFILCSLMWNLKIWPKVPVHPRLIRRVHLRGKVRWWDNTITLHFEQPKSNGSRDVKYKEVY